MKKVLSATIGLLAISAVPAMAADLPVKARPMVPVVTAYNWTGCYIGVNGGGKWARTSGSVNVGPTGTGVGLGAPGAVLFGSETSATGIFGGQVGCNYQPMGSNWVFGIEGDVDWHRWSRSNRLVGAQPFPFVADDVYDFRSRWQASVRGRVGYAWDRWMLYATGGAAATNVEVGTNFIAIGIFPATVLSDSKTVWGPTVGLGFEYAFWSNLSFGLEGRYSWYGSKTYNAGLVATVFTPNIGAAGGTFTFAPATQTVKLETFEIMAKLNLKIF
jgi:outer membrane immunogenic protein